MLSVTLIVNGVITTAKKRAQGYEEKEDALQHLLKVLYRANIYCILGEKIIYIYLVKRKTSERNTLTWSRKQVLHK